MNTGNLNTLVQGPRLGRLFGIDLHLGWSWFLIAFLCLTNFSSLYSYAGLGGGPALLMAALTTVLLFASIIAHELGHALTARNFGIGTRSISLNVLGGIARLEGPPRTPREEFLISGAGPAVSLVLGGVFALSAGVVAEASLAGGVLFNWLGWANLVLGGFNLLPAFPLDGGRMLRAWVWDRKGSQLAGTETACRIGQGVGICLYAVALFILLEGAVFQALMFGLLGMFIRQSCRAELMRAQMGGLFGGAGSAGFNPFGSFGESPPPRARPQVRVHPAPPSRSADTGRGRRSIILEDGTEVFLDE